MKKKNPGTDGLKEILNVLQAASVPRHAAVVKGGAFGPPLVGPGVERGLGGVGGDVEHPPPPGGGLHWGMVGGRRGGEEVGVVAQRGLGGGVLVGGCLGGAEGCIQDGHRTGNGWVL